jgi:tetratricopeptide (TPR) repeat protein
MRCAAKPIWLLILMLALPMQLFAETTPTTDFDQANQAYSQGNYQQAITIYEKIIADKGYSAPLLYNLANSYAQNGQTGRAILNYERALILAPSDADITGNLEKLRQEAGLFDEQKSPSQKIQELLTINQWALLLLISLAGLAGLAIFQLLTIRVKAFVSVALLLPAGFSIFSIVCHYQSRASAIVISPSARLLISPFDSSSSLGTMAEGRRVSPLKRHQNYYYVTDAGGRKGWLAAAELESIREETENGSKDEK